MRRDLRQLGPAALLLACALPAGAVEMFGLSLARSTAADLRAAVKQAGAVLVREGGTQGWDVYRSHGLLADSRWLFLGFTPDGGEFAFLEYVLDPRQTRRWRTRLAARYGEPRVEAGRFLSDGVHLWRSNGVRIRLYRDFGRGVLRLEYAVPERLQRLQDRAPAESTGAANPAFY